VDASVPIGGHCAPGFERVRRAFADNFAERGEIGAGVTVLVDGEVVVDLAGGWADEARNREFAADALTDFYSVGKALLATLLLREVDAGGIGLDDTIASVWPEFAQGGKDDATIRHALTHTAGVPAIRRPMTDEDLFDWSTMTDALAATEAWYPPGEQVAYHTNTYGHLVGELLHRISGVMPGPALRATADRIGADVWFGLPEDEQRRCTDILWDPSWSVPTFDVTVLTGDHLLNALSHFNPPGYSSIGLVNTSRWRGLQLGSTAGHGSARGIARWYQALLDGDLLSEDLLSEASRVQVRGRCPILADEVSYGLGFTPTTPRRPLGPNPGAFGHFGSGGALGFADPVGGVAFGYVMNQVIPRWQSTRNRALIDAVYASLAS
jgi:CubicO group peptidase (beta-lactamase class C family)